MAIKRNVRTGRAFYTRKPSPVPKKRGIRPSQGSAKFGAKLILAALVLFGLWRFFAVQEVVVRGNKVIPKSDIEAEIDDSFRRHQFSKNLLTLSLAPLARELLHDQRFSNVVVARRWPNKVEVVVTERHLSVVWQSANQTYLLDSNGVAVVKLDSGPKGLPVIVDSTGLLVKVGSRVAPQRFVQFASVVAGELTPSTGLVATTLSVPDTTTELDVKVKNGYTIKFDTQSRVEDQLTSLKTVLSTLVKLKKTPTQYIDLRIPGKAYYL